jgi:hypothetical protein
MAADGRHELVALSFGRPCVLRGAPARSRSATYCAYEVAQIWDSVAIDDEEKVAVPRALIEAAIRERVEGSPRLARAALVR